MRLITGRCRSCAIISSIERRTVFEQAMVSDSEKKKKFNRCIRDRFNLFIDLKCEGQKQCSLETNYADESK